MGSERHDRDDAAPSQNAADAWTLLSGPTPGPTPSQLEAIAGCRICVIGYGNQGRAHALNLQDSGLAVTVALREGSASFAAAEAAGLAAAAMPAALSASDLIMLAAPDAAHREIHDRFIAPFAPEGAMLGFLHGHSIHFGEVEPREDLVPILVAPKGPGVLLRQRYLEGRGIPALVAAAPHPRRRDGLAAAIAYAHAIGCGRSGIVRTSFEAETVSDLFGEQAVLCGGVAALLTTAFEVLVDAGMPAPLAYLECVHELKQVVDLLYERGPAGMRRAISPTAAFGSLEVWRRRDRLVDRGETRRLLAEVISGEFSRRMADDDRGGGGWRGESERLAAGHPLEEAGRAVRSLMPWLAEEPDEPPRS